MDTCRRSSSTTHQREDGEWDWRARSREPVDHHRELHQVEGEGEPSSQHKNVVAAKFVEPL